MLGIESPFFYWYNLSTKLFTLFHSIMFKAINNIQLAGYVRRTSKACAFIYADVMSGRCVVHYNNGTTYEYKNVSRRALYSLLNNENVSLGFFINNSLVSYDSKCAQQGAYRQWLTVSCA